MLQPVPLSDIEPAAPVGDQAFFLQLQCRGGDGRSLHAEHVGQHLLGQVHHGVAVCAVLDLKQEARQAATPRVHSEAGNRLKRLVVQGGDIVEDEVVKDGARLEVGACRLQGQLQRNAADRHDTASECRIVSEKSLVADDAVGTDDAGFAGDVVLERHGEGHHAGNGEPDVADRGA